MNVIYRENFSDLLRDKFFTTEDANTVKTEALVVFGGASAVCADRLSWRPLAQQELARR